MKRVSHYSVTGIGVSRVVPRPHRRLLIAPAMLVAVIVVLWLAAPRASLAEEQARPVHVTDGANAQRPSASSPEQLNAKATAELEETREMIAKMKAHGIGG